MIRTGIAFVVTAFAAAALATGSASATRGHVHHCGDSIRGHHVGCNIVERVVDKWTRNDYSYKHFRAGGIGWHCWFVETTARVNSGDAFNCFSNRNGRITGTIKHRD